MESREAMIQAIAAALRVASDAVLVFIFHVVIG